MNNKKEFLVILGSVFLMLAVFIGIQYRVSYHAAWSGTTFFINRLGYMVTANHVVDGAKELDVIYKGRGYRAYVVAVDPLHDVAIIKTFIFDPKIIPITIRMNDNTMVGILGFPDPSYFGFNLKLSTGTASYAIGGNIHFNVVTCPGNSGGPVIDNFGNAVGLSNWGYTFYEVGEQSCTTRGGGPGSSYIVDLANKYSVPIDRDRFTMYNGFNYWYDQYKNSVTLIYGYK